MNPPRTVRTILPTALLTLAAAFYPMSFGNDPVVVYATYIGGSDRNSITGAEVGDDGKIYVVGSTTLADFPGVEPLRVGVGGSNDIFAASIDPNAGTYDWVVVIGGDGLEVASDFTLSSTHQLFITGYSIGQTFPTQSPIQSTNNGGRDIVAVLVSPDGEVLFSTFLGGSEDDLPTALDIGPSGEFVIAGYTESSDFPLEKPVQDGPGSEDEDDAFLSVLDPEAGTVFSTYFGGDDRDRAQSVAVDQDGRIWLGGRTRSFDFQLLNAFDESNQGIAQGGFSPNNNDGFVTSFEDVFPGPQSSPPVVTFSSYLGGSASDGVVGLSADALGNVFVVGTTLSPSEFPLLNPFQSEYGGSDDGFFTIVDRNGALMASSYFGLESVRESMIGVAATNDGCAVAARSAVTLGTADYRTDLSVVCADGSTDTLGTALAVAATTLRLGTTEGEAGRQTVAVISGNGSGIETTQNAVQSEPPAETGTGSFDENGFLALVELLFGPQTTLEVSKTPNKEFTVVSGQVDWVVEVTNTGDVEATNVSVRDFGGAGLATLDPSTWVIPSIPVGATQRVMAKTYVRSDGRRWNGEFEEYQGTGDISNTVTAVANNAPQVSFTDSINVSPDVADEFVLWVLVLGGATVPREMLGSRSVTQEVYDVYIADSLALDDVETEVALSLKNVALHTVSPKIDIVEGAALDNSTPVASGTPDLTINVDDSTLGIASRNLYVVGVEEDSVGPIAVRTDFRRSAGDPGQVDFFLANMTDSAVDLVAEETAGKTTETIFANVEPGQVTPYSSQDPQPLSFLVFASEEQNQLGRLRVNWSGLTSEALAVVLSGPPDSLQATIIDGDGELVASVAVPVEVDIPEVYELEINGNHPNPFAGLTTISFDLPEAALVQIQVFDLLGRRVLQTEGRRVEPGTDRRIRLDTPALSSGSYLYRLTAQNPSGTFAGTGRLVIAK